MTLSSLNEGLLLLHAATTLFMVGVIWFVQMVHYPLFEGVGENGFSAFERQHTRRTGWVVAPPMLAELATAIALAWRLGGALAWSGLFMLMVVWLCTWLWQVPAHHRLEKGFDAATHRRLVRTNWVRTIVWSTRGILALAMLVEPRLVASQGVICFPPKRHHIRSSFMQDFPETMRIAGVDLAWGDRRPDGVCVLEVNRKRARVRAVGLAQGDDELLALLEQHLGDAHAFIAMDAPVVCRNFEGARPVDRLTHVHFGRFKAGSHPCNLTRCRRPPRVATKLEKRGFTIGTNGRRVLAEVYPHPAMVRLFELSERIPYKRGRVEARRREFRRLQAELRTCLAAHFPALEVSAELVSLLDLRWTKNVEDQTDAFFCALIGYWHWLHRGEKSEVLGDLATGFILLPRP